MFSFHIIKKNENKYFYMEAGNRCFDQRVPEETNRKIADVVSDINLTYSDYLKEYLILRDFLFDRIIKTGSPIKEFLMIIFSN